MDDEKVIVKGVKVQYMTTKVDAYENELCYFKLSEKNFESKFAAIIKENVKTPWFRSDKGGIILKVKSKYLKLKPVKDETVTVELSFKYYKMDNNEGYYVCGLV